MTNALFLHTPLSLSLSLCFFLSFFSLVLFFSLHFRSLFLSFSLNFSHLSALHFDLNRKTRGFFTFASARFLSWLIRFFSFFVRSPLFFSIGIIIWSLSCTAGGVGPHRLPRAVHLLWWTWPFTQLCTPTMVSWLVEFSECICTYTLYIVISMCYVHVHNAYIYIVWYSVIPNTPIEIKFPPSPFPLPPAIEGLLFMFIRLYLSFCLFPANLPHTFHLFCYQLSIPKALAKPITLLQIVQMVLGFLSCGYGALICEGDSLNQLAFNVAGCLMYVSYAHLFIQMFSNKYSSKKSE